MKREKQDVEKIGHDFNNLIQSALSQFINLKVLKKHWTVRVKKLPSVSRLPPELFGQATAFLAN